MRKILLSLLAVVCLTCKAQKTADSVIMTVGSKQVSLAEFEYIAHKNNEVDFSDSKSLMNYIELFGNFKLKVVEAESLGLDNRESFKQEWEEYKTQLIDGYMSDKQAEENLAKAIYKRADEYLVLKHIFIPFQSKQCVTKDTLAPFGKAMEIYDRIAGGMHFDSVSVQYVRAAQAANRDEGDSRNGAEANVISVRYETIPFFLPMQKNKIFEEAAYATAAGNVTKPFRSADGYHIVKVEDRRPYFGKMLVAYINIPFELDTVKRSADEVMAIINEAYGKAISGEDFTQLVYKYSADTVDGGVLSKFGPGEMLPFVEKTTYALAPGEISKPLVAEKGAYIFKLIEKTEAPVFDDVSSRLIADLGRKGQERNLDLFKSYDDYLKKEYKYVLYPKAYAELEKLADEFFPTSEQFLSRLNDINKPLFRLNGKDFTQQDFGAYIQASPASMKTYSKDFLADELALFVREEARNYEQQSLTTKYPEIALLLQEYRDGILLFDVSNDKIWSKPAEEQDALETAWVKELNEKYTVTINQDALKLLSKKKK
ncbi:MAG: peptidylprolyl isomerase [Tannerellaceae bacterium]|jgi:peptidyl-prolyl cis-trans isomerase SurA|nr:peptidylprolyl isomerase [Tannerellaceae bacterium]